MGPLAEPLTSTHSRFPGQRFYWGNQFPRQMAWWGHNWLQNGLVLHSVQRQGPACVWGGETSTSISPEVSRSGSTSQCGPFTHGPIPSSPWLLSSEPSSSPPCCVMLAEAVQAPHNQQAQPILVSGVSMGHTVRAPSPGTRGQGRWPGVTVEWSLGEHEDIKGYRKGWEEDAQTGDICKPQLAPAVSDITYYSWSCHFYRKGSERRCGLPMTTQLTVVKGGFVASSLSLRSLIV